MSTHSTDQHRSLEQVLLALDRDVAADPSALEPRLARARVLIRLNETERAKQAYIDILSLDPTHRITLNNLATLLYQSGYTSAARTAYRQAVTHHPGDAVAHTNLANLLFYTDQLDDALVHYSLALALDSGHCKAHQGLALLFERRGDEDRARHHRDLAYGQQPYEIIPYTGVGSAVPLLLLISSLGGTVPWRRFVDDRIFQTTTLALEYVKDDQRLPPCAVIFNAIGDADLCRPGLEMACRLLRNVSVPILNAPIRVLATGRQANATRCAQLPGVTAPRTYACDRAQLAGSGGIDLLHALGLGFPLLLRSPGFHTGHHFIRVQSANDLDTAAQGLPGQELLAIEYLDVRSPDGLVRKYRVMCIDGCLHPLHLALANDWKVHYFTSAMRGNADFQAEEARFLADMPGVLGSRAMAALTSIRDTLGLDYCGIDFALRRDGGVILFEANATMLIEPPTRDPQWDYRRPAIDKALTAARAMLISRAAIVAEGNQTDAG